ncbi:hypothetical protein GWK47_010362 [Chionoecetes opilio]|uniref:Condensation domain-containing protein n=1 Tax=Chionoecetes opilio TaxID=41210 RepID=A0A8J4XWC9_CHIOP|nr:hypothetical protein GWK47_010362 [Chionoecetes opilio]
MEKEAPWVRKLTEVEKSMDRNNQEQHILVVHRLSFCSRRPVKTEEVEEALGHLYRKAPNLRLCIRERGEELWFREMDKQTLDFEVEEEQDVEEVTQFLHTHSYTHEGPMWRARLVPVASPSYQPPHLAAFHQDLRPAFPHCYHILLGFTHAIGDGHTFVRVCAALAHLLDRVLCGGPVDQHQQVGSFALNEEYDAKSMQCTAAFFTDLAWREKCIAEVNKGMPQSPLLPHVLSQGEGGPGKTLLYTQTLEKATTSRLLQQCRGAGVTLSSCLAAAGNLALVELLQERGVAQDTYSISNCHLINMRRTWPPGTAEHALGCYFNSSLRMFLATPRAAEGEHFWQYAKYVHGRLYGLLQDEQFLEKAPFNAWCYATNASQHVQRDLTYNTRGDLTHRLEGTQQLTVTNLLSSCSIHKSDIPWDHVFGTVRGRLSHTLKYNTTLVTEDTARAYAHALYHRLIRVAA